MRDFNYLIQLSYSLGFGRLLSVIRNCYDIINKRLREPDNVLLLVVLWHIIVRHQLVC